MQTCHGLIMNGLKAFERLCVLDICDEKNQVDHLVWKSKLIWQEGSEGTDTFYTICHLFWGNIAARQNMVTVLPAEEFIIWEPRAGEGIMFFSGNQIWF